VPFVCSADQEVISEYLGILGADVVRFLEMQNPNLKRYIVRVTKKNETG
jgi:hypothetical protein